jgi:hemoglobin
MNEEIYTPMVGPPQGPPPDPAIFKAMGVEGITYMLQKFYRQLGDSPIAHLFPTDPQGLDDAGAKSALFFVAVCGGPSLYAQAHGPPRMRARHLPFAIDESARRHWLACWPSVLDQAVTEHNFPAEHRPGFERFLTDFSAWMVNRA